LVCKIKDGDIGSFWYKIERETGSIERDGPSKTKVLRLWDEEATG